MYKRNKPYILHEEPGTKRYCACGKTKTAPYCDESHRCTDIYPIETYIEIPKTVAICGCGKSKNLPYCDGSHECSKPI
ncbi:MAG: CDGSH iron-sulfur domain-containing protein [Clostridia bacterium]|nr:CDGSH iron-sulfur domain-containing protein [Clostridia bacterium]